MKRVYLDNAATTPLAPEVIEEMTHILKTTFGNPSSQHSFGREAKAVLETARNTVAKYLNAKPSEIIFTGGGSEADNMVFNTAISHLGVERVVSSSIEHHAVVHTIEDKVKRNQIQLEEVRLTANGHVDLLHLEELLARSSKKTLVSLMHGNNEIGNLLPLKEVSQICRKYGAFFHSDTVQTMSHYRFDAQELDIDFMTCSAHKFHGPKGVGFLYLNHKVHGTPLIFGGSQERGMRGGTENVYGIAGLAKAMEISYENLESHQNHIQGLKSYMIEQLKSNIQGIEFHGDAENSEKSMYTVLNVNLPHTKDASMVLFSLDLKGIACSGGSACASGSNQGSHVLAGIQADSSRPNARFSFSRYTTKEDIDYAVEALKEIYPS